MRGALIVIVLIAMLIVGYLTMKNMGEQKSGTAGSSGGGVESIQKAEEAADDVQDKLDGIRKQADAASE